MPSPRVRGVRKRRGNERLRLRMEPERVATRVCDGVRGEKEVWWVDGGRRKGRV